MRSYKIWSLLPLLILIAFPFKSTFYNNELTAREIVEKADQKLKGNTSYGELKMTIVRPSWTREIQMKNWSLGDDYALILITAPARDKGAAFLKRGQEIWNWQPTIDRVNKLPPSMMMQSWMGSDFTNDDLVKQSSIVNDFEHTLDGTEPVLKRDCYKIQLIPKEDAAVVWGKIIMWIDKEEFMQLKTEFYDEDGYLVNTMTARDIKTFDGNYCLLFWRFSPADEDGNKTIVEYLSLEFENPIKEQFFSVQNMKRVR